MGQRKKRKLKEQTRNVAYAFRMTEAVNAGLERVAKECSRTKSLQCDHFIKEGLKNYEGLKNEQEV